MDLHRGKCIKLSGVECLWCLVLIVVLYYNYRYYDMYVNIHQLNNINDVIIYMIIFTTSTIGL
jgi:hypothetical protein